MGDGGQPHDSMMLNIRYMGLELTNPIVCSASPLSESVEGIRRMADAGAGAVVLFSLFEEQLRLEEAHELALLEAGSESFAEALSYFPRIDEYRVGPDDYLKLLERAVQAVDIPVLGSLNGITPAAWTGYARRMQEAGARGIELNLYVLPTDPGVSGAAMERRYLEIVQSVKASISIPLAVKLSTFLSAPVHMARRLKRAGADALVLFNRFYQPDIDVEALRALPTVRLSEPEDIRLPLRWIAILSGRVRLSLAATGGVDSPIEVVKYLLAGADVVMTTSSLLKHGVDHLRTLTEGLEDWMRQHQHRSVRKIRGLLSHKQVVDPTAFERAHYIQALERAKQDYILRS